jgi:hypothetical protein
MTSELYNWDEREKVPPSVSTHVALLFAGWLVSQILRGMSLGNPAFSEIKKQVYSELMNGTR